MEHRMKKPGMDPRSGPRAWQRGLAQLEADLQRAPVPCSARYTLVWAKAG